MPKWISVEKRKPPKPPKLGACTVPVLLLVVHEDDILMTEGDYNYSTKCWHLYHSSLEYERRNVTHWMPLPKLPKRKRRDHVKS